MRVLPEVEAAEFDVPTETFTIEIKVGASRDPVLAAIKGLGYEPEILSSPPSRLDHVEQLRNPTSRALQDALSRAKARNVPLVIDFGGPFCHLCRKFEDTTLRNQDVRAALVAFEFIQVDVEEDPAAAKDLDVHGVPDIWVLNGGGKVLARNNGYLSAADFVSFLADARE